MQAYFFRILHYTDRHVPAISSETDSISRAMIHFGFQYSASKLSDDLECLVKAEVIEINK